MVRNARKNFAFKTGLEKYYTYTTYRYNRSTKKVYNESAYWNITNFALNISWEGEVNNDLPFCQWSPGVSNSGLLPSQEGSLKNEISGIVLGNSHPENMIRTHNDST